MSTTLERFLIQWRRAILRGASLQERLVILRQLASAAGTKNEWKEDIVDHERVRLSVLPADCGMVITDLL